MKGREDKKKSGKGDKATSQTADTENVTDV